MARFDRVIPPGEEGQIVATVDTQKYSGPISKAVKVRTNDPENPVASLVIKADVKNWVEVLPGWMANLTTDKGKGIEKVLLLKNMEPGTLFEISAATSSNPWVKPRIEKVEPGSEDAGKGDFRLILALSPEAPAGAVTGQVVISTVGDKRRRIQVGLAGRVHGPIAVFPTAVNLFAQPASGRPDRLSGTITLQARPEHPTFQIEKMESDDERLKLETIPDTNNRRHRIAVRWTAKDTKGDFSGTIHIQTSNPDMPEIEVPYRVRVL